jgi:3-deoxy-D-manno-octulosonic-acid transferase
MGPFGHSLAAVAGACALPFALGGLLVSPRWRRGLGERLGAREALPADPFWIHAASVGEMRAALPLLDLLAARGIPLASSAMTSTGRALARAERPQIPCHLAPIDHPWIVARAIRRVAPRALVFVETELWPSWILAARERGVPVFAVSARLSERSVTRYRKTGPLIAGLLRRFSGIGARSDEDAARFVSLGADADKVVVTGDLKEAAMAAPAPLATDLAAALGACPLFVAGSTHEGEERAALEAFRALRAEGREVALLLAPRHEERFDGVVRAVCDAGFPCARRSALSAASPALAPGEVMVLDSLGELAGVYARAALAFIGGSLSPRGGHNPLEAAQAAVPIVVGPHIENTRAAFAPLLEAGAARRVDSAEELVQEVRAVFRDLASARSRGMRGRERVQRGKDVARVTVDWLLREIPG